MAKKLPWSNEKKNTEHSEESLVDIAAKAKVLPSLHNASWISRRLYWWFLKILHKGHKSDIDPSSVTFVERVDEPLTLYTDFLCIWNAELVRAKEKNVKPRMLVVTLKTIGYRDLLKGIFLFCVQSGIIALVPYITQYLLVSIAERDLPTSQPRENETKQILLGIALLFCPLISTFAQAELTFLSRRISMHLFAIFTQAVFKKALLLSSSSRNTSTSGKLVNLISNDAGTVLERMIAFIYPLILSLPLTIVLLYLISREVGISVLAGCACLVLFLPLNIYIFVSLSRTFTKVMVLADKRIGLVTETLQAVRIVKMYAWEIPFIEKIFAARENELVFLRRHALLFSVGLNAVFVQLPYIVEYAMWTAYYLTGNPMTPTVIFPVLQLFQQVQGQFTQLPNAISQLAQSRISLNRIGNFLMLSELESNENEYIDTKEVDGTESVVSVHDDVVELENEVARLSNASFSWCANDLTENTLTDLDFSVLAGQRVAVFGFVASGKSSFLLCLIGEMKRTSGFSRIAGSLAYVPQTPFVFSCSVRDNILFGSVFNRELYDDVLEACCLLPDLEIMPAGDQTFIGERGINLSGGQKARLALARAVYAQADINLLDDPLSAVDSHVGASIISNCILGKLLKNRTVIFTTNQLEKLVYFDKVVHLENGMIKRQGKLGVDVVVEDLVSNSDGAKEIAESLEANEIDGVLKIVNEEVDPSDVEKEEDDNILYEKEAESIGPLKWDVFVYLLRAVGIKLFFFAFGIYVIYLFSPLFLWLVLTWWSQLYVQELRCSINDTANCDFATTQDMWFYIYSSLIAAGFVLCIFGSCLIAQTRVESSRTLHTRLIKSIFRGSITEFFDVHPMGRIINRFAKDISIVDFPLFQLGMFCFTVFIFMLSAILGVAIGVSWFTFFLIPVVVLFGVLYSYIRTAAMQLQRTEARTRSPIYSTFSEVLNGLQTIRAFSKQTVFIERNRNDLSANVAPYFLARVILPSSVIVYASVLNLLVMAIVVVAMLATKLLSPSQAGLAISYTLRITQIVSISVAILTDFEISMNSVERIKDFCKDVLPECLIKQGRVFEGTVEISENKTLKNEETNLTIVDTTNGNPSEGALANFVVDDWPSKGEVSIRNLVIGYREGPDVLHGISVEIHQAEKIGICGRTGSGKSSFFMSLLRVVEARSGSIFIDNVNIASIPLSQLRSHIAIIPQSPVLFQDSLRFNLDPVNCHTDSELLEALEVVNLGEISDLNMVIAEGGANVSEGQRQLICFVRALLRKSRLLLLDEATAMLDRVTDENIQNLISEVFVDRTVVTVAHRLRTLVKNSSHVIVLDQGNIVEFDETKNLLANSESSFFKMLEAENSKS